MLNGWLFISQYILPCEGKLKNISTEAKPQLISQRKSGGNQIILHKQSIDVSTTGMRKNAQKTAKT